MDGYHSRNLQRRTTRGVPKPSPFLRRLDPLSVPDILVP